MICLVPNFNFHSPSNHCGLWYIERERKEAEPLQYDLLLLSLFMCWPAFELVGQPLCFESPRLENVYCSGKKGTLWTSCATLHSGVDEMKCSKFKPKHTAWIAIWMTKRPGANSDNGFTCWLASELVVQPLCFESPWLENVYCSGKKGKLWTSCAALHSGIDEWKCPKLKETSCMSSNRKGQLISKCLYGVITFFQKMNEN